MKKLHQANSLGIPFLDCATPQKEKLAKPDFYNIFKIVNNLKFNICLKS